MKSCGLPDRFHGVDALPENRPGTTASRSGSFHVTDPVAPHCLSTSCICVASRHPARSTRFSDAASASVPSTGPLVSTGESSRTRRFAFPTARAIRCATSSPNPGVNHGRTSAAPTSTFRGSILPVFATVSFVQSSSKLSV